MKTHRSLLHVIMRVGGSVSSARRETSTGTVRARAARGILVLALALVLGSLGAAASASPGHGSAGQVHASAYQSAASLALPAAGTVRSGRTGRRPWMW
jgi:hypothetical protein